MHRCFGLGLGSRACRRLLHGVAKLTGGRAEFLCDDERLQPKVRDHSCHLVETHNIKRVYKNVSVKQILKIYNSGDRFFQ